MKKEIVQLTPRELQIVELVCSEVPVKAIAVKLSISENTVKTTTAKIRKKIQCNTVAGIVKFALTNKLVKP